MTGWSQQHAALQQRRETLRLRSGVLRLQIARDATVLGPPLALADQVRTGWRWLRAHPEWPLLGGVVLVVWRPRRALRLAGRLWWGWRVWLRASRVLRAVAGSRP
jgi:YqjK-like protein